MSRKWSFNPSVGILFVHTWPRLLQIAPGTCFNPSVGILFVHTHLRGVSSPSVIRFQSLGRDSVCSYSDVRRESPPMATFQSLGRDSVCSYLCTSCSSRCISICFNPSVGILFVHTCTAPVCPHDDYEFQSLGRDSVCSYSNSCLAAVM